jgi:glycosyltransferase involved in cell wall biosynthesis
MPQIPTPELRGDYLVKQDSRIAGYATAIPESIAPDACLLNRSSISESIAKSGLFAAYAKNRPTSFTMPTENRLITILTPTRNEKGNVRILHERIHQSLGALEGFNFEHLFIDNASNDGTEQELRSLAADHASVKVIFNNRNFGHVRSPFHGLLQARGDAVIVMAADMQDPPELIPEFVRRWQEGHEVVLGQKNNSAESPLIFGFRKAYYRLVRRLADVELVEDVTGFGLYSRKVIEDLRSLDEPYPYVRGLISELGYNIARVSYKQPKRQSGFTKNNFYTLYDVAMLGITSHSKVPLRLATMLGFAASAASLIVGMVYLVYKLLFWQRFALGVAPVVIGLFFVASVQLLFIGIIGEYIGAIHTRVIKRPLVIERERINF